jgi:hypothetical protein
LRKLFAAILAVVLVVPLLFAALVSFAVSSWALDRGFYVSLLSDQWRAAPDARLELPPLPGLQAVPEEALGAALREVLSARYLRSQAINLVNQTFDALEGRAATGALSWRVDLAPLKADLRGEAGPRFARRLAEALPACAGATGLPAGAALPPCRPESMSSDRLAQLIVSRLPAVLDSLPDTYVLANEDLRLYHGSTNGSWYGFVGTRGLLWAAVILGVIAASFWIGVAFLAGRDRREILQWLGGMLAAPAALTLLAALGVRLAWFGSGPWFTRRLPYWLGSGPGYRDGPWHLGGTRLLEVFTLLSRPFLATVGRGFLSVGAVAAGVAAGLIIWSLSAPRAADG